MNFASFVGRIPKKAGATRDKARPVFLNAPITEFAMRRVLFASFGLFLASPVAAEDMPPRKPGLWEIKMTMEGAGMPPMTSHHCVNAETDQLMNTIGGGVSQGMCSKQDVKRVGNSLVVDSTCSIGGITTTSHGVMTGDFNAAYTVKVSSKREGGPPQAGPAETRMQIAARWTGPCKADQKPGDIIMPFGIKVNILDLKNMQGILGGLSPGAPPQR
jgi:hypothetical protein